MGGLFPGAFWVGVGDIALTLQLESLYFFVPIYVGTRWNKANIINFILGRELLWYSFVEKY